MVDDPQGLIGCIRKGRDFIMDKSRIMLFVIIGLLVILIGTVVGVTIFLMGMMRNDNFENLHEPQPPLLEVSLGVMDLEEVPLGETIITNLLAGPDGRAGGVRVGVVASINSTIDENELEAFVTAFNARMGAARNVVVDVFNGLTFDEVRTPEWRRAAQEEIRIRLQETFETTLIVQVQFSEWTVQNPR